MKTWMWIIALTVLIAGASMVSAEDMKNGMMGKGMGMEMMSDKKMMGMCPTMKGMMDKTVVATSDGGIVIVMGNKITKYDKNLNVVKEVELKMDMEGMHKMMENMKGMCPMMKGMSGEDGQSEKADEAVPAAQEVDHSSHH
jgi:hypothetical protein